jgi:ankyrin repeat protein
MTDNLGPSVPARVALPERANLEHLKNQAKARLNEMRHRRPDAQLSEAQFELAREYGFGNWRALKAHVDKLAAERGASPNSDRADLTARFVDAARAGRIDELLELLDRDPSLTRTTGAAALQHAAWRNRGQAVRRLLERGVDVRERVGEGDTALHYAAETADCRWCGCWWRPART